MALTLLGGASLIATLPTGGVAQITSNAAGLMAMRIIGSNFFEERRPSPRGYLWGGDNGSRADARSLTNHEAAESLYVATD